MPTTMFSGVVLPERAPISVSNLYSQIVDSSGNRYASLTLNIWQNQLTVSVDSAEQDIFTLRNIVRSEAEFVTNIAGFLNGYGYEIEITKVFDSALNITQVFGIDIPVLAKRSSGRDLATLVKAVLPLCYGQNAIFLRRCLGDLSFAIKRLDDTAFYCFRALESLRHSFGIGNTEAHQWKSMAKAINSSKEEMEILRRHAFPARHGNPKPLTDDERQKIFTLTWDLVERYIDYRLIAEGAKPAFSNRDLKG